MIQSQLSSYIIENATLWTAAGVTEKVSLWVENGRLKAMGSGLTVPASVERIRLPSGAVVMPAGVDAQAHLRVPGQGHKELPQTGILAALRGGYSALLTMPNTQPTIDSVEVLREGQEQVKEFEQEYGVQVYWSAAITKRLNSDDPVDYEALIKAGVKAFTNDGLGVASDQVMEQAFAALERSGVPLLQHAEFLGHGGALAPGPVQEKVQAAPYPDDPEWKMVERDIRELGKHPRARYHVLHVSSRKTIDFVRDAKKRGMKVTAEVSPHHLYFNTETIDPDNKSFKMNPPIRSKADQEALWQALASGEVDFVATDHAPHELVMKTAPFDKAAFGTIGLETTLPVLIDGWKRGLLSPARLVQVFATEPARFLNLPDGHGALKEGAPFHAAVVDVNAPKRAFTESDFSSLSKNSCFLGAQLPGKVTSAFHETRMFTFA